MKFLKKALPLCLLALALVITITLVTPKAEAATVESGTCGSNLTWTLDDAGTLTISGTGKMTNYSDDYNSPTGSAHPWKNVATSIKSVVIESGVTSIGDYAFCGCESLTSITIPDSVTSIGDWAFFYCSSLTSVTIPDSVTSIGDYAFCGCYNMTSITIGDSLTSIGDYAFDSCGSLTGFWVDTENPNYCSDDHGVLFNKDMTTLIVAPGGIDSAYTIPDSVTSIGDYAFRGCSSLTSITIGDSVTSIGSCAFYWCSSLTSIAIPDSVTSIGRSAFFWCSSLTSIAIPDSVTSIGDDAFWRCSSLTEVTIPAGMKKIGNYAFQDCSSLKTVYYGGSQTQWSSISIGNYNGSLTNATIHYNHIHDYTLLPAVTVEPTCTQAGYIEYTCMYGETYRKMTLPALGHTAGADATVVAPTCTEQGYTESTCSRCGVTGKTDYVPALGHDFSGKATVVESCTEQGYTQTQCIRCEATEKSDYTDPVGHKGVAITLKDATCTEQGVSKIGTMCERCGTVFVQPTYTPALGHDYAGGTCSRCGEADPDYVPEGITGDLDGDNAVSNNDVVALLWYTLFPEENTITGNADFTGDGNVTNEDVVMLLWHCLFPEENPL